MLLLTPYIQSLPLKALRNMLKFPCLIEDETPKSIYGLN